MAQMVDALRNAPSNVLPIYRLRLQLKLVGKGRNYTTYSLQGL